MSAVQQQQQPPRVEEWARDLTRFTYEAVVTNDTPYDFNSVLAAFDQEFGTERRKELYAYLQRTCKPDDEPSSEVGSDQE